MDRASPARLRQPPACDRAGAGPVGGGGGATHAVLPSPGPLPCPRPWPACVARAPAQSSRRWLATAQTMAAMGRRVARRAESRTSARALTSRSRMEKMSSSRGTANGLSSSAERAPRKAVRRPGSPRCHGHAPASRPVLGRTATAPSPGPDSTTRLPRGSCAPRAELAQSDGSAQRHLGSVDRQAQLRAGRAHAAAAGRLWPARGAAAGRSRQDDRELRLFVHNLRASQPAPELRSDPCRDTRMRSASANASGIERPGANRTEGLGEGVSRGAAGGAGPRDRCVRGHHHAPTPWTVTAGIHPSAFAPEFKP
jgi:hypothetical protein